MTDEPITRAEYEEYKKRLDEENKRQDKRIELLEESTKQINALAVSIEKLAQSVESMVKEQETQSKRLVSLENRDGEMWRKVVGYVATAVIGIVVAKEVLRGDWGNGADRKKRLEAAGYNYAQVQAAVNRLCK